MKKKIALGLISVILLFVQFQVAAKPEILKPKDRGELYNYVEEIASDIFVGTVEAKESKLVETSGSHEIWTFVDISIYKIERSNLAKKKRIIIVYEGGTVGDITSEAYRNPFGTIDCELGQKIRVFAIESEFFKGALYALMIEPLSKSSSDSDIMTLATSPSPKIYEEHRLKFEWTGNYFSSYSNMKYYVVNTFRPSELDGKEWFDAIKNSFQTWENLQECKADFTHSGNRTWISGGNGKSEVGWYNLQWPTKAICYLYPIYQYERNEFDIKMNTDFTWTVGKVFDQMDVQNCMTHEAGHPIGLRDLYYWVNSAQTMWYETLDMETKKRTLEQGDKDGAQHCAPQYTKPTVSMYLPYDETTHYAYTYVSIEAYVSSGYSISSVQFRVTSRDDFSYDSGFQTMTKYGDNYVGSWYTYDYEGYFYVLVRAKHSENIYGYDWHTIYLPGPIK